MSDKIGRNDPCPCGSGKKYKKCCMSKASRSVLKVESLEKSASVLLPDTFDSLDDVFASLRSEGFEPVLSDHVVIVDHGIDVYDVDLYCEHGLSCETRSYWVQDDGTLLWDETSYSLDSCPLCP